MKLSEARILFKSSLVYDAKVYKNKSKSGWILELSADKKVNYPTKIHTERGAVRIFKSTDAALSAAKSIGFKKVTVLLT